MPFPRTYTCSAVNCQPVCHSSNVLPGVMNRKPKVSLIGFLPTENRLCLVLKITETEHWLGFVRVFYVSLTPGANNAYILVWEPRKTDRNRQTLSAKNRENDRATFRVGSQPWLRHTITLYGHAVTWYHRTASFEMLTIWLTAPRNRRRNRLGSIRFGFGFCIITDRNRSTFRQKRIEKTDRAVLFFGLQP